MFSDVLLRMKTSLPLKNEKIEKKCKKESAHFWKDLLWDVLLFYAHHACFRKQAEGRKIIFLSKEHFFRVWFVVLRLNMDRGNSLARLAKKSFFVCRKNFLFERSREHKKAPASSEGLVRLFMQYFTFCLCRCSSFGLEYFLAQTAFSTSHLAG